MKTPRKRLNNLLLCSMNFLLWKGRRGKWTNDSSSAEQVCQRLPYNGPQKRRQLGIRGQFLNGILRCLSAPFEEKYTMDFALWTNIQFEKTRKALQSKQRDLKWKGMSNKPNASAALSEENVQVLFEKDLLGSSTAEALIKKRYGSTTQSILVY